MANPTIPFRVAAARHRKSLVYTVPWNTGQRVTVPLNNIGYLEELQIVLALTVTVLATGTATDADAANSNFLPFIGLRSPQGEQLWTTNSRDVYDFNYRLFRSLTPANDPSYSTFLVSSATAQPVNLRYRIPVAINDGENFDFGLIMRQISNNQFFLDLQMAAWTDLVGTGTATVTSITGQVFVEELWYDAVPDNSNVIPPNFAQYVRLRSLTTPTLVQGQNDVRYDTGPVIVDAFHRIMNNNAKDASIANVSYIQFLANKGNEIDNRTGARMAYDATMHLGKNFRGGVYHEDFCDDVEHVNTTKGRDFINSNLAAQLDFLIQYAGTPSGTSFIASLYREIVSLAA